MAIRFVLSDYVEQAMAHAVYDKLEDGTFAGRIPPCKGVVAFAATLRACEEELRSVLEDWILVGLKLKHPLPVIDGIDLNKEPAYITARQPIANASEAERPGLVIRSDTGDVWVDGHRTDTLTRAEWNFLSYLYSHQGEIVPKQALCQSLWQDVPDEKYDAALEKLVSRLRNKIEPNPDEPRYVLTVRGRGYRLVSR